MIKMLIKIDNKEMKIDEEKKGAHRIKNNTEGIGTQKKLM